MTEQVCTEKSVIGIFDTECSHIASRIVKPLSESLALVTERIILGSNDKRFGQALEERPEYHGVPRAAGDAGQNVDPDGIRQLIILGEDNVVRNHTGAEEHGKEDKDRDGPAVAEIAPGKGIRLSLIHI